MWVLGKGQKPFLELLRNLSIQFIIAGFITLLANKSAHAFQTHRAADGWTLILVLTVLCTILGLAVIANLKGFFSAYINDEVAAFRAHKTSLAGLPSGARFKSCAVFLIKNCKRALFESSLLVLGIYAASVVGLFVAIDSATNVLAK